MNAFPDTSFLWALYRQQDNSEKAAAHFKALTEPLAVSHFVLFEFRQSLRWQTWLHQHEAAKGISPKAAEQALADLESDLVTGAVVIAPTDAPEVFRQAESLSAIHTKAGGHRAFDILHVATALVLGARDFLTFDANQRKLAAAVGLRPKP